MNPLRPRELVHRGSVEASGFLFFPDLVGEAEVRRRVLQAWVSGSRVHRCGGGWLLRLPTSVRVDCATAPGLPLVRLGTGRAGAETGFILSSLPLAPQEWAILSPNPDAVVYARKGEIFTEALSAASEVDVSEWLSKWLEVAEFQYVEPRSLGTPPPPAEVLIEEAPFEARSRMEGVPPASPELRDLLFLLQKARERPTSRTPDRDQGFEVDPRMARAATALGSAFRGLFRELGGLLSSSGAAGKGPAGGLPVHGAGRAPSSPGVIPPDWELPLLDRLSRVARRAAARMLINFRLSGLVGRRQAEYVARMLDMFERGDLTEALRHAIPLGSLPGTEFLPPSLGFLAPRADLTIQPFGAPVRSAIGMGGGLFQDLESIYRRAHERLAAEGRIDEAAFVLVELLQAYAEAAAFLERHGRFQLAAEIAEARELPPGLIIRLWLLAGDRDRAVRIARRTGAFADAVTRLEQTDPQLARYTRLLWADALASAGDYAGAVEAAWPIEEGRPLVQEWIERVLALGGVPAARMLPRKLALLPETWGEVRTRALELLAREDAESGPERMAFADALRKTERTPASATLARATVRALVRDAGAGLERLPGADFRQLIQYAGDSALRTDLPPLPPEKRSELHLRTTPLEFAFSAADVGALPVMDAAYLPGGRCLAALGEAGVRLLTRDGRTVAHFDQPAHHLVVSDRGDRALALARRGDIYRIARLDLLSRRAESWCEARLDAWASDYDGSLWFAAGKEGFLAIDATAPRFAALWRTKEVPGRIIALARNAGHCSLLIHAYEDRDSWGNPIPPTESWERWTYQLPQLVLRQRGPVRESWSSAPWRSITPQGRLAGLPPPGNTEGSAQAVTPYSAGSVAIADREWLFASVPNDAMRLSPIASEEWVVAGIRTPEACELFLFDQGRRSLCAKILLEGAGSIACRFQEETLTVTDDRGRLLVVDLRQGRLLRNLRLG